jgi:hypothetical protein
MTPYKDGEIQDPGGRHQILLEPGCSAEQPELCGRQPQDVTIKGQLLSGISSFIMLQGNDWRLTAHSSSCSTAEH